ncbi:MAG: hypothetical protein CM1200mP38_4380 [Dehalococcoidia bacterium]|nr:MAG: hypothetical protein CM1200mP38_4380 [Dehalococcoidia bacterium]
MFLSILEMEWYQVEEKMTMLMDSVEEINRMQRWLGSYEYWMAKRPNEIVEWMKEEGMAEDLIDEKWHDSKFHRKTFHTY